MGENKFRVLVAERPPGEVAELLQMLHPEPDSKLELSVVSGVPILLASLELAAPEVIFFDLSLGRPDPLDAVRRLHRAAPGIPLIVFADLADKNYAPGCLSEGAIDYLLKGFMDGKTLERSLRTAMERNTLESLVDLLRDALTGLYNRDGFVTLGAKAMEEAARSGGTLVLVCARIENLAAIRESSGSSGCEEAVRDTAGLLRSCFRRSDFLARLGEAQFAVLAIDAAERSAQILRQRLESRRSIESRIGQESQTLALKITTGFWGADDARSFAEFLDAVELELRQPEHALIPAESR